MRMSVGVHLERVEVCHQVEGELPVHGTDMRELAVDARLLDKPLVMSQGRLVPLDGPRVDFARVGAGLQVGPEPLNEYGVLCL